MIINQSGTLSTKIITAQRDSARRYANPIKMFQNLWAHREFLLTVVVQMFFFLTPIFYPISAVPAQLQFFLYLNPLTFIVNHFRRVALLGMIPDWNEFLIMTVVMFGVCLLGYIWFMKSKKTFADVV